LEQLVDLIQAAQRVVVVTGAGVSTESNIPDYRGPQGAYTTGELWRGWGVLHVHGGCRSGGGGGWGVRMRARRGCLLFH
jgi:hypothetical protein